MNLIFVTEARFVKNKKGVYGDSTYNTDLWNRYLNVFENIYVLARVKTDESFVGEDEKLSSRDNVEFLEVPYYVGLRDFIKNKDRVISSIKYFVKQHFNNPFICRVPGTIGNIVIKELSKLNKKYALEVVGDPWEVFSKNAVKTSMRPLIRIISYLNLKKVTRNAEAVLYVTEKTLQKRYPAVSAKFITTASNVMLYDKQISPKSKIWNKKDIYNIISIGSLEQMYKSPDIVLKALNILRLKGFKCNLTWLGEGIHMKAMKQLALELKLQDCVSFVGNVDKDKVLELLRGCDLFVLASRTEGLPRAMIEAMAQGLPCIGTRVGGIPELIDEKCLVKSNSVGDLADKIENILTCEPLYNYQARRNLIEAHNYSESRLSERRNSFYNYIVNN